MKSYIYQLSGGKMLVFQDGWIGIEETGYPTPDCTLRVGERILRGQQLVMRAILGYDVADAQAFITEVLKFGPMKFEDFKYKILSENIGGGCPTRLRQVCIAEHTSGLSKNLALFKYILPISCVDENCWMPSEEDIVSEYADMLAIDWSSYKHIPNWRFKNNMILLTGCREVTQKHIDFIKDVVAACMLEFEKPKYHYISGITLSNGNGAIVLTDTYAGNVDAALLYQRVTGADLSVGKIVSTVDKDGALSMHFEYVENVGKRRRMPEIKGVVKRQQLGV